MESMCLSPAECKSTKTSLLESESFSLDSDMLMIKSKKKLLNYIIVECVKITN